ncbi:MAG: ATP-binding protein, partial [Cyanobacteria bacterium P01_D01_bin.115]
GQHRRSGSGLGLHLSQRIVAAHHGTLSLESEVGQGSTFTVKVPIKPS